ncbi:Multidrug resistance-associated protein 1, partial [Boothiomyces sp. JEL0866]
MSPTSLFSQLAQATGKNNAELIMKMARSMDLFALKDKDRAYHISKKLEWFWNRMNDQKQYPSAKKPSLYWAVFLAVYSPFIGSMSGNFVGTTLSLIEPIFLQLTIMVLEGKQDLLINDGRILGLILVGCQVLLSIYQKSLRLSLSSRAKYSEGKILNLINQDIDAIIMGMGAFECTFVVPAQIIFTMFMLYTLLGNAAFVAFGIVAFIAVMTAIISPLIGRNYSGWIEAGDKRLAHLREMLYAVKVVKFETLEDFFKRKIGAVRKLQVSNLKREFLYWSVLEVLVISSVIIMIAATFSVYTLLDNEMNPAVIFPAILYFTKLQTPLDMLSWMLSSMISGYKSMERISEFMLAEEMELQDSPKGDGSVVLSHASFTWDKPTEISFDETVPLLQSENLQSSSEFKLKGITINIKPGSTVGIVGKVGAGKSTLLSSIIGEVLLEQGDFHVNGKVAYCPQQPWILTGSIEKNIVFNSLTDEQLLTKVVNACGLGQDLNELQNGLQTEIGENGVNLSGGQKARVALARSIYSDADIFLLDDPLAAVDAHTSRHIFKNVIRGLLKDKTVLLVTHQLQYLNQLDHILVIDNGEIVESGSFDELSRKNGLLNQLIQNHTLEDETHEDHVELFETAKVVLPNADSFMEDEEQNAGSVKMNVYFDFFKAIRSYYYPTAFFILLVGIALVQTFTPLLLASWTSSKDPTLSSHYLFSYSAISGISILFSISIQIVGLLMAVRASCNIHDSALSSILQAPLSFFDQNPIGRILNRFSSDVEKLDRQIGYQILLVALHSVTILCNIVLIAISNYFVLILFVLITYFTFTLFVLFRPANLDLQRMLSVATSPLDSHVSETLAGIAVVRAYRQEKEFIDIHLDLLDKVLSISYIKQTLMVWFKFRVNIMATCVTLFVVTYAVQADNLSPEIVSIIALALTRTSSLGSMILEFMKEFGFLEGSMNAVERLTHYCD